MEENREFIESLERLIKRKRENLGVLSNIAEIKSLSKYTDLDNVVVGKSFNPSNLTKYYLTTKTDGFSSDFSQSYNEIQRTCYIFDKIVSQVAKQVASDLNNIKKDDNYFENINKYIKDNTDFKGLEVTEFDVSELTDDENNLLLEVVSKLKKSDTIIVTVTNDYGITDEDREFYSVINYKLTQSIIGDWRRRVKRSRYIAVRDIVTTISIGRIIKDCCAYLNKNTDRAKHILATHMHPNKIFEGDLSDEQILNKLTSEYLCSVATQSKLLRFPIQIISLMNKCMSDLVSENKIILDYKTHIKNANSSYARPYMTKKNISQKIENFMNDNNFLNMFGYVEADTTCDIDKLNKLSDEFLDYAGALNLPVVKSTSLRFRKLGNLKASGVYYPTFKALCVDMGCVNSFTHEMFHMIDFEQDVLSLDYEFKDILDTYKKITTDKINSLDKMDSMYTKWHSKNKYNKDYYLNNSEVFARMGELYVSEIMKIRSSFVPQEFNNNIIYPKDKELLDKVKIYFDSIFNNIGSKYTLVSGN